jgi:Leucine-rich repeat (LRR) protein
VTFPNIIFQLSNLKTLSFASNSLSEIPESIEKLSNLEWLYLERVLKVQKTALKPSEHQIYHSNMNEGSA